MLLRIKDGELGIAASEDEHHEMLGATAARVGVTVVKVKGSRKAKEAFLLTARFTRVKGSREVKFHTWIFKIEQLAEAFKINQQNQQLLTGNIDMLIAEINL
ncbi:hypothetical protein SESBI_27482 [Sesbania bispinosa]|nr:hypothetical protein SESBI_27482 [Sesbania bispinosa]